jgi:hypothetical protein
MDSIASLVKSDLRTVTIEKAKSSTTISRERHAALFSVINKVRMLNGWQTRTAQELDATIRTWNEVLEHVPIEAYPELYKRSFQVRARSLNVGKQPPDFDATLLYSQWIGENGLRAELHRKDIESGRLLTETAVSDCDLCHGSGYEITSRGCKKCSGCGI